MLYLRPNAHEQPLPLRRHTAIEGKTCGKISLVRPFAGACGLPSPALCLWRFASALDKLGRIVHTISDPGYLAVQRSPGGRRARRHASHHFRFFRHDLRLTILALAVAEEVFIGHGDFPMRDVHYFIFPRSIRRSRTFQNNAKLALKNASCVPVCCI